MIPDPLIALRERLQAHKAATAGSIDDRDTEPQLTMEDEALTTRPTTPAGAIAALEWAAEEVRDGYGDEMIAAGSLSLALIAGAIDVLRKPSVCAVPGAIGGELLLAIDMVECARLAAGALDDGEPIVAVLGEARRKLFTVNEAVHDQIVEADELRGPA